MKALLLVVVGILAAVAVLGVAGWLWYSAEYVTETVERMEWRFVEADRVDPALLAETRAGRVAGSRHSTGVVEFRALPFARPPVGDLRWAAPRPAAGWTGTLDASRPAPRCMQPSSIVGKWPGGQSEDCLWLSVWTPEVNAGTRPVVVWIHGGGLWFGGAGETVYDGGFIAERGDVVVVNVQYRLGVFGWLDLAHLGGPEVARSGTNGELDVLLALEWIQQNIARFGGDPENVTLMGESAGSYLIASLLHQADAAALFHKAVLMSGVITPGENPEILKSKTAERVVESLGGGGLEELRARSSADVLAAQEVLAGDAAEGGSPDIMPYLEMRPPSREDFRRAGLSGKPLLHGNTRDEYHFFTLMVPEEPDLERAMALGMLGAVGVDETEVEALADIVRGGIPDRPEADVYLDVLTAALMFHPHRVLSDEYGANGAPVYYYLFDWESPLFPELGAFHALDLPFAFGTLEDEVAQFTVGEEAPRGLSDDMIDAITSFARTGQPAVPGLPAWPSETPESRPAMLFSVPSELVEDPLPWLGAFGVLFEESLRNR